MRICLRPGSSWVSGAKLQLMLPTPAHGQYDFALPEFKSNMSESGCLSSNRQNLPNISRRRGALRTPQTLNDGEWSAKYGEAAQPPTVSRVPVGDVEEPGPAIWDRGP